MRLFTQGGTHLSILGNRVVRKEDPKFLTVGGMYVDDRRYGRVLVSWGAFERFDVSAAGDSGPAYTDFPPGRPLTGTALRA